MRTELVVKGLHFNIEYKNSRVRRWEHSLIQYNGWIKKGNLWDWLKSQRIRLSVDVFHVSTIIIGCLDWWSSHFKLFLKISERKGPNSDGHRIRIRIWVKVTVIEFYVSISSIRELWTALLISDTQLLIRWFPSLLFLFVLCSGPRPTKTFKLKLKKTCHLI